MAIFISLNRGATVFNTFKTNPSRRFTNTSVYGKKFDCYGELVDGGVGALEAYISVSTLNDTVITLTFDYDVERADLFGKTAQSNGSTSILSGISVSKDKRQVYIQTRLNTSLYEVYLLVYINGNFGVSYNLVQTLENCTSNISGSKIDEGMQEIKLTTSSSKYVFDKKPTLTMGGNTLDFNLNNDLTVATVTVNITDDVVINAVAKRNIRVHITGSFTNATCNYVDGEFLDTTKDIIISANNGFTFKSQYEYTDGAITNFLYNEVTYLIASMNENNTRDIYLNDDYIATKEIEQVGTFVNLYKTNQTELTKLSKVRFSESMGQVTDYGGYINSLYILPFNIPSDILGNTSTILLGNLDSNVESTLIATYLFDVDMGSIEVPLKYDNIYDYVNTECILHLPFLDKVFLQSEYVIGQTLTITFTIELYSGNLTVNIVSSFNNEIVASVQGLIGMNIPFIQKSNGGVINSVSNVYKNRNNRCFIEVNRNIPYTKNNNVFGGSVVEYGKIGDYTGYLECDSLVLNTKATNQEQEEIKNIIRNGVFI